MNEIKLIDVDALIKHLNTTMYRDVMEEIKRFPVTMRTLARNFKSKTEDKFGKIDEIVSEYITNSSYNACDAMEDIIQILDEQEPHYYNKIKEKVND